MKVYKSFLVVDGKLVSVMAKGELQLTYSQNEVTLAHPRMIEAGYGVYSCTDAREAFVHGGGNCVVYECEPIRLMPLPEVRLRNIWSCLTIDAAFSGDHYMVAQAQEKIVMSEGVIPIKQIKRTDC